MTELHSKILELTNQGYTVELSGDERIVTIKVSKKLLDLRRWESYKVTRKAVELADCDMLSMGIQMARERVDAALNKLDMNLYLRPLGILLPTKHLTAAEREEFLRQWYALHIGPREPAKVITADAIKRLADRVEMRR